jgi:membrane fusion protein, copper/silver efflux system
MIDRPQAPEAEGVMERPRQISRVRMAGLIGAVLAPALFAGAFVAGVQMGKAGVSLPRWLPFSLSKMLEGEAGMASTLPALVLYYRNPDGKAFYSPTPMQTADGRDYTPVRIGGDVSFVGAKKDLKKDLEKAGGAQPSASNRKISYYRNPMGLPDISSVPKKDSMGMDYIPVYEEGPESVGVVMVTPGKVQRTGVRTQLVERRSISRPLRAPGVVQLDERRITIVSTRSETFIEHVENVTTGDRVRKGQTLLHLYSPEIATAAAQYVSVTNEAGPTSPGRLPLIEGARRRLENLNVPSEVMAEIERTRKVPTSIAWTAPRDGVVLERDATEGMRAPAGQVLFRIADTSTVWVIANVPERELALVKPAQAATIRIRSLPGRMFTGRIGLIYPQVIRETRTVRVRIELSNADAALLADMYADVELAVGDAEPVVAVPADAVIDSGTRQIVLLAQGDGRFEPRDVKIGARGDDFVEIREGVQAGDRVVTSANFLIDAESNLKAALQGLSTPAIEEKAR